MAKWTFMYDLMGNRVPKVAPFPAATDFVGVVGDLVYLSSGKVTKGGVSLASVLGLLAEEITTASTEDDPIKVYALAPGMVIRGTADADASSVVLTNKTMDINAATQTLDVADTSNGCLLVYKASGSGSTVVDCLVTEFDLGCVN